jgi:hypothetical protein
MGMQTDVHSDHASVAGSMHAGRTRLKGLIVSPKASTAATFEIRNGGATADVLFTMDIASNTNPNVFTMLIPGEGILATDGLYLTLSVGSVTGITVFHG